MMGFVLSLNVGKKNLNYKTLFAFNELFGHAQEQAV